MAQAKARIWPWLSYMRRIYEGINAGAATSERTGSSLKSLKDLYLKHSSSQGQNLALTVFYVLNSPDSGLDCLICAEFTGQLRDAARAPL